MAAHPLDLDRRRRSRRPAPCRRVGGRPRRARRRRAPSWCRSATATRSRSASCARRRADAPTILIYGHYDVQSVGDLERVDVAAVRARGPRRPVCTRAAPPTTRATSWPLLHAACALRARGRAAGQRARRSSRARRRRARRASRSGSAPTSAAPTRRSCSTPGWSTRTTARDHRRAARDGDGADRGAHRRARPALGPLRRHASSTRVHVLHGDARRRRARRRTACCARSCAPGIAAARRRPSASSWERLQPGAEVLAEVGGRGTLVRARPSYYERNGADASLDVNAARRAASRARSCPPRRTRQSQHAPGAAASAPRT